ncbi:lysylphosphatidylglycerol synthase transmembrane domain-containing protein [Sphingobacterium spiritivorum]|uniref:lysylphosphatidylglycerol synthase transmembrane domain-containing protein n=1 Tax=Sphingobacterium spiritivorum TaxID=258 RepID=UPI003DA68ED0
MTAKVLKIFGIIIVVGCLVLFLVQTDFKMLGDTLDQVGYRFIILILITAIAYILATAGWYYCMAPTGQRISLYRLFFVRQVGETIGLFNPTNVIGGDLFKVHMLRSENLSKEEVTHSVFLSRVMAILSQLLLLAAVLCWYSLQLMQRKEPTIIYTGGFLIATLILGAIVCSMLYITKKRSSTMRTAEPVIKLNFWLKIKYRITHILHQTSVFYQHYPSYFWYSFFFFTLHWFVGSLEFYVILRLLGANASPMDGLFIDMGVIIVKSLGAFIPGQIGIEELGNKIMLSGIGLTGTAIWISASVLRRARQLVWTFISLICYFLFYKFNGSLIRQS